jgi:SAM-dependent methyltransferase
LYRIFPEECGNNISNIRNSWRSTHYMIKDVLCMYSDALILRWLPVVKLLGRYQGKNGQIDIVECSWDGTRVYFEEGIRQSQATPDGESVFTYVKLMDELLSRSKQVLVLGCGGGTLAARLSRLGKRLTIVDNNPISFVLAQKYFDLPDEVPCIVSDFRKFVFDDRAYYDAIAIDVGGPGFRFTEEFDVETCDAIRTRLAPGGRIVMNVMVANDIDPTPDRIAARLAGEELRTWIVDEQFIEDRNAVIACIPEKTLGSRAALDRVMHHSHERWAIRRGRLRSRDLAHGLR